MVILQSALDQDPPDNGEKDARARSSTRPPAAARGSRSLIGRMASENSQALLASTAELRLR